MNTTTATPTVKPEHFTRVNNDVNGNPRYVCHYLKFITIEDTQAPNYKMGNDYEIALKKAKKIGGRKFHNKQYGGGIVFQSYNIQATADRINELLTTGK
jgi:hypothetical protein